MHGYDLALFLHICGAVALFSVIAIEIGAMAGARRATTAQAAADFARLGARMRWVLPVAVVWLWAAAGYLVSKSWKWDDQWVSAAMLVLILVLVLHFAVIAPRLAAAAKALDGRAGPLDASGRRLLNDPVLWTAAQVISTATTGVIALMVFKPDGPGSAAVAVIAVLFGLLSGVPALMRYRRAGGAAA